MESTCGKTTIQVIAETVQKLKKRKKENQAASMDETVKHNDLMANKSGMSESFSLVDMPVRCGVRHFV